MKSNKQKGAETLARLADWLDAAPAIPERGGKANITAIADAAGVDRQVIYTRPEAKQLVEDAVAAKGLGMPDQVRANGNEAPAWATRRIHKLEQELAAALAEVDGLRDRLQACNHIEAQMISSGMLPR